MRSTTSETPLVAHEDRQTSILNFCAPRRRHAPPRTPGPQNRNRTPPPQRSRAGAWGALDFCLHPPMASPGLLVVRIVSARVELVGPSPKGRQNLRGPRKCIFPEFHAFLHHDTQNRPRRRSGGQGPLTSLCRSGSSIEPRATQISRNTSDLCIQYGRAPFFGKVPSVQFLIQR